LIALLLGQSFEPLAYATDTPATAPTDPGWPRSYPTQAGATLLLYQPQVESWANQSHMVLWAASAYTAKGAEKPDLGTIKFDANTTISTEARQVHFTDLRVLETHFPSLGRDQTQDAAAGLKAALGDKQPVMSLDRVLGVVDKSSIAIKKRDDVKADPPIVAWSQTPAVLVNLDGPPVWSPISRTDLEYAVNTNWDLFQSGGRLYLRDESSWYAADSLSGAWSPAGKLPASFSKLPADSNWSAARANIPGKTAKTKPRIFVSESPSELVLLDGPPRYQPVTGTQLQWVANTESDLFRMGTSGAFYFLVAGRWFSAATLDGPWTFATPKLPPDFAKIPVDHPRSRVLASVPGSDQAIEAVLLAQVPQTARVSVKQVKAPDVVYQSDPKFETIQGTSCSRAVNTDKDVIMVSDSYYLCYLGVWFVGPAPGGPWVVAATVPTAIYQIPASSPAHNVTYVTIVDSQPNDDWVTFSYVAAYTGLMVAWGCAVWGTGWHYPPYVYWGPHPVYYPYPCTYGFGAWYNPYTGAYGRGAHVYGPYGGAGCSAAYNPRTGTYARGAAVYGPYNSRAAGQAWNPRTGAYAQTRQGSNVYGNWGSSYVQRGDKWAASGHVTNYATGTTTHATVTGNGGASVHRAGPAGSSTIAHTGSGDVYAGHDGNVYRKENGDWQKWNGSGWSEGHSTNASGGLSSSHAGAAGGSPPSTNLDHDHAQRDLGNQRAQANSAWRSGGRMRSGAGSFGGGTRGGRR
jgi:hypothetical protein